MEFNCIMIPKPFVPFFLFVVRVVGSSVLKDLRPYSNCLSSAKLFEISPMRGGGQELCSSSNVVEWEYQICPLFHKLSQVSC